VTNDLAPNPELHRRHHYHWLLLRSVLLLPQYPGVSWGASQAQKLPALLTEKPCAHHLCLVALLLLLHPHSHAALR
jgi:hypothetical protein